jgi:hypothetical protein
MRVLLPVLLFLALLECPVFAQTAEPVLLCGVVRDEPGSSVPRVKVKAKKNGTGRTYETSTNGEGRFVLELPRGIYKITFWLESFKKLTLKNISMPASCIDVELKSAVKPHNIT